ncbi:uncharacterized protein SOCEGT47_082020 [Sorangium cellulosum]|uniref:Uncharacterized protein n=1 Tax=Sorangium cellulosum TaxID=56 RepID=A0A4P2QDY0_SORCE|nr:uncharacterized protein SOCEGT47_082020 [Sorangium cellulosum]
MTDPPGWMSVTGGRRPCDELGPIATTPPGGFQRDFMLSKRSCSTQAPSRRPERASATLDATAPPPWRRAALAALALAGPVAGLHAATACAPEPAAPPAPEAAAPPSAPATAAGAQGRAPAEDDAGAQGRAPAEDDAGAAGSTADARPVVSPVLRPAPHEAPQRACSFTLPLCVHAPAGLPGAALLESLAHAEAALRTYDALGLPRPLPDGDRGGSPSYDLYLERDPRRGFLARDPHPRDPRPRDPAPATPAPATPAPATPAPSGSGTTCGRRPSGSTPPARSPSSRRRRAAAARARPTRPMPSPTPPPCASTPGRRRARSP